MGMDELEDIMMKAADKGANVRVVCTDGEEYTGMADYFAKGADEEDGFATFCVGFMCLGVNEIKSIEFVA